MPVTILERLELELTEGVETSTATMPLAAYGSEDETEIIAAVEAYIPAIYQTLVFHSYTIKHVGGGTWEIDVRYSSRQVKEVGESTFTFDTTGGTAKITQSLETAYWQIGENAPPQNADAAIQTNGAINLRKDGSVDGVEILVPQFSFTVTRVIADPLPQVYADALLDRTARVNNDVVVLNVSGIIFTFQPGELLFEGATGGKRGSDAWEITLKCSVSRNAVLDIGEILTISKYGHDYLWVLYEDVDDAKAITAKPKQVMTEQVYNTAELSALFT